VTPVEWDAETYDRVADPQFEWGQEVLTRLHLEGGETVLDAGCGTGRLTALLLELVPDGRVIGVDASRTMIEQARATLSDRAELIVSDLLRLELPEPVDVIFSNAAFHWITDHDRLFQRLHGLVVPGGVLEAQCGGQGNVAEFERAVEALGGDERFAPYLRGERRAWNFASVADTEARLERAGWAEVRVRLEPKRVTPREPREFLRVVGLSWHLDRLPGNLHDQFIDAVIGSMAQPLVLDYVRLNISARRP
jgi:trans-aconitate 2-methyltransferase